MAEKLSSNSLYEYLLSSLNDTQKSLITKVPSKETEEKFECKRAISVIIDLLQHYNGVEPKPIKKPLKGKELEVVFEDDHDDPFAQFNP